MRDGVQEKGKGKRKRKSRGRSRKRRRKKQRTYVPGKSKIFDLYRKSLAISAIDQFGRSVIVTILGFLSSDKLYI